MLYIVDKGTQKRFVGGYFGQHPLCAIYQGQKKIWPGEDDAHAITVIPPTYGTIEWAYWVHALDSINNQDASWTNNMRFYAGGLTFYINKSPDGTPPYIFNQDTNRFELGEADGVAISLLGEYLTVHATIPQRRVAVHIDTASKTAELLPYLDGSWLEVHVEKPKKRKMVSIDGNLTAINGGQELANFQYSTSRHKRGWYSIAGPLTLQIAEDNDKFINGHARMYEPCYGMQAAINLGNSRVFSQGYIVVVFPAFEYTFKLKITGLL